MFRHHNVHELVHTMTEVYKKPGIAVFYAPSKRGPQYLVRSGRGAALYTRRPMGWRLEELWNWPRGLSPMSVENGKEAKIHSYYWGVGLSCDWVEEALNALAD